MSKREWLLNGLILAAGLAAVCYSLHVWYTYPCDAWKSGLLRNSYVPGRCIK